MNYTKAEKITIIILITIGVFSYLSGLDYAIAEFMGSKESIGISLFFSFYYYIIYVFAIVIILWKKDKRALMAFILTMAVQSVIHSLFSTYLPRPRPMEAKPIGGLLDQIMGIGMSSSFPSSHSAIAASVYTIFSEIGLWKWYILLATIPILISRITLAHHHISDVIGGIIMGYVIAKTLYSLLKKKG